MFSGTLSALKTPPFLFEVKIGCITLILALPRKLAEFMLSIAQDELVVCNLSLEIPVLRPSQLALIIVLLGFSLRT